MQLSSVRLGAIAFFLVLLTSACNTSPEDTIRKIEEFVANREYRLAVLELKSLLQTDKDNVRARWMLGEIYLQLEDGASAEKELVWARSLGVEDDSVVPLLAQALNLQARGDEVLGLEVKGSLSARSAGELDAYRGLAHLARGEPDKAQEFIDTAVAAAPDSVNVRFAQAQFLTQQGGLDEAKSLITGIVAGHPDHGRAWSLLGDIYLTEKAYPEAEAAFTEAVNFRWNAIIDRTKRGLMRIGQGNLEGAEEDLNVLLKRAPNVPFVQYFTGVVRFRQQDFPEAVDALEAAYGKASDHVQTAFLLGLANFQVGNVARARDVAEKAFALAPGYVPVRKLLAHVCLKQGEPGRAEELLRPVVAVVPNDVQAKDILASSLIDQGKAEEASQLLQEVAAVWQDQPGAQLRAGIGFLATGQEEKALATLQEATALSPQDDMVNTLAVTTLMQAKQPTDALESARGFAERNAGNPTAQNLLGVVYQANGRTAEARQSFERALQLKPGDPLASENLATLSIAANDPVGARSYLQQGIERNPDNMRLLYRLASVALVEHETDEAVTLLRRVVEQDPDHAQARIDLARQLLVQGDARQALLVLLAAPSQNSEMLFLSARAYLQLGQLEDAKLVLERLREQAPNSPQLHLLLAGVYSELNDIQGLQAATDRILQLVPGHPRASIVKARLLAHERRFEEAQGLLASVDLPPDDTALLEARLFLARQKGDRNDELVIRQRIHDAQPSTATIVALGGAYARSGDPERGGAVLAEWLARHPNDTSAVLALADLNAKNGRQAEAVAALERVLAGDPENVAALNNLAWYLREQDPHKALDYAKRAHHLAPSSVQVLSTYAEVLARNHQGDQALRMIERAVAESNNGPAVRLRRAEINYHLGHRDAAIDEAMAIAAGQGEVSVRARAWLQARQE